jgi:hypothetical protein
LAVSDTALLDSEPRRPMRVDGIESYMLGGLAVVIVAIWFAGG